MVAMLPWLVRAILLLVDLMPLVLKIAGGWTLYGRRLKDRAAALRHADRAELADLADRLERRAAVERRRRQVDHDTPMLREQQRHDQTTRYLRRTAPTREL
jgi:hypothetical protein